MKENHKLALEEYAQLIVDYFFTNCGARVSAKDYKEIKKILEKLNNEKTS